MATLSEPVPKLFQPIKVGDMTLGHRVVMAPLTRGRATKKHVHTDLAVTYYAQRASVPGTLIVAEATFIAPRAGLYDHVPGVWNDEQIAAWKKDSNAIHAKGSYIYLQLWAHGRAADLAVLRAENPDYPYVSSSDIPLSSGKNGEKPRPLTIPEIKEYVETYAQASRDAVFSAGFDGVEVHCAHGYLVDQFIQDTCNKRTDEYGGSIENRCRFALEVIDAVVEAVGPTKTGFRLSPWSTFQDMRMDDPVPTFTYLVSEVVETHPDLAFIHLVEPGVGGGSDIEAKAGESNDFIRKLWLPRPLITAGRYTRELAIARAEEIPGELPAFGRLFISNPDLPLRLRKNLLLTPWNRAVYYTPEDPHGYTDYPFAEENCEERGV
ncbi:NADH:flavin oxidoreductase/NADH oxidase [Trametes versicolor FP-101664 SS1]|uniref:NADH:flavin oxidoreductase/NADH oxidase n=1 Tax=Trametes versicolor (strain FP-101664) TaxID=717944 RepID=UPI000462369C|nr:NADH:flavin oxidoreductase/NADH oxidase [Trametes versicolor FP-101664 SS1]EIW56407.1 NADH:flavin oxidoreductase/NADH oxidase [Trametes versicolor FP-101664 SS1]